MWWASYEVTGDRHTVTVRKFGFFFLQMTNKFCIIFPSRFMQTK